MSRAALHVPVNSPVIPERRLDTIEKVQAPSRAKLLMFRDSNKMLVMLYADGSI